MSVPIETIHASDFLQPGELVGGTPTTTTHIIARYSLDPSKLAILPNSYIRFTTDPITEISDGLLKYCRLTGDNLVVRVPQDITLGAAGSTKKLYTGVSLSRLYMTGFTGGIRTTPSGSGQTIYADAFVTYCMASIKDDIRPIPPAIAKKPLNPRIYKQHERETLGFVAELCPPEIVDSSISEEGLPEKGINVLGLCALQQAKIDDLEARVAQLEKKL